MIKRLSQCIREYKKDAILSPLYVLVESLLDVAIPFVMAGLIDKGIEAGNMSMILRYGAILVGFALVALTFGALSGRSCARGMICFIIYRYTPSPILINSAALVWSPV